MFTLWRKSRELASMEIEPLVASWDSSTSTSQIRLRAYLDSIERQLAASLKSEGATYLSMDIAVPQGRDILHHYDLENYLTPVAKHLRSTGLCLASATKSTEIVSRIATGVAEPLDVAELADWSHFGCNGRASSQTRAWKEQLRNDIRQAGVSEAPPGPLGMHIAWRLDSARRNWLNLWKPTGDALGPILGEPMDARRFEPYDDRIVALDLHLHQQPAMGFDVEIGLWWRPVK